MKNCTKHIYVCCLGLLLCLPLLQAQSPRAKGLVYNPAQYQKNVKSRDLDIRGSTMRELPIRLSLRPFCPTPQDQGAEPSCSAWAIAYGALTIQQAVQRKVSNTRDVDKIACSKSFVFNQLLENNDQNIPSIEETFRFLRNSGTCLAATFRNDLPTSEKPDELAVNEAQARRLVAVAEVYDPDPNIKLQRQIQRFKRFLADSMPIVVGLRLPYSFSNLSEKRFQYDPEEALDSAAHALCLIGYDDIDSTFEFLNSWGTNWGGDQGFVRLRYEDMFALICCAYRITPQFLVEKRLTAPRGTVVLRRSAGYNAQQMPQFEEIRLRYDTLSQQYQPLTHKWQAGASFQLVLREAPVNWWVYVFSINAKGEIGVFHRQQISSNMVEKVIPGEESKFELDEASREWMYVLYSKDELPDFKTALEAQTKSKPGDIDGQVRLHFKNVLSNPVIYNHNRMGFSSLKNKPGTAALMFLKLETD